MTKPHPKSTKEIKDWFVPGKLYMPTKHCLAWNSSKSSISMFNKVAYYPHYHPLLFLSATVVESTINNIQLNLTKFFHAIHCDDGTYHRPVTW